MVLGFQRKNPWEKLPFDLDQRKFTQIYMLSRLLIFGEPLLGPLVYYHT